MADFKPNNINGVPIPYDATIADLQNLVKSPVPICWVVIRALSAKNEIEALETLVGLINSPDWRFRRSAAEAIGISPIGRDSSEDICRLLYDPNSYVKRAAIEAAAKLRLSCAHDKILSLIKAVDVNTKITALAALEDLWNPGDFYPIFDRYLYDTSDRVHKISAKTIHRNIDTEHWRETFSEWVKDSIPRHRIWACELLRNFGSKSDLAILPTLLQDNDGHVRQAAKLVENLLVGSNNPNN